MTPKEQLASGAPKCANCKHMVHTIARDPKNEPGLLEDIGLVRAKARSPHPRILGKGACMEPSVAATYPHLFYVTDLTLCSLWEKKE